jgi:pimeloyl-ACP methyl ester carboxylesterase
MRQKRITINGKEISYYESRDNGHPVVLVHGISSSSAIFIRQLIDSVLSYQFRFIALDLIGYGNSDNSDAPEKDYTIKGLSKLLVDFSNELQLENSVYVGHNSGANIILESLNDLKNPKGLVLLGAAPFSKPLDKQAFQDTSIINLFSKAGLDSSEVHQLASYFVEENTKYPDFIPEIIRKADLKTREYFFASVQNGDYDDQHKIIKELNIPVAVYYGEHDQIVNFEYVNSIDIPTMWRSIIQIIREAGHIFFYENPADFNVSFEAYLITVFN